MKLRKVIVQAVVIFCCVFATVFHMSRLSASGADTAGYDVAIRKADQNVVFLRGISVEGQSLEGMTLEEARQWINNYVETLQERMVTLSVFNENRYDHNGNTFEMTWTNPEIADQLSNYLTGGNFVEQYKMQKELDTNPVDLQIELTFNQDIVRKAVQDLATFYSVDAVNATVSRVEGGFSVSPEIAGKHFDVDTITAEVLALVSDYDNKEDILYELPYTEIQPQYTTADFNFSSTPLGAYATNNLGDSNRYTNIALSAAGLNGRVVYPGEEVSTLAFFNISAENGYQMAPGYENGQQVESLGGGVCQTTTTLYNAVIRAELEVTERKNHSMIVTYVPPAMDATVALGGQDFKFRNNLEHPIYIEAYADRASDVVAVYIWGVEYRPANRTVDFRQDVLECIFPDPLYNISVNDSMCVYGPEAAASQKITATVETHPQVKARSYKRVFVDGVLESETELNYDMYRSMPGIMYVASDCNVSNSLVASSSGVYKYLGYDIFHNVTFKNGVIWDPRFAEGNY